MRSAFIVSVLVLASAIQSAFPKEDPNEAALRALDQKWIEGFTKKDVNALAAYYADDAVVMDPGPALQVRGKEEIRKSFGDFFANADAISFVLNDASYHAVGNLGYGYGTFTMSYKDKKTGQMVSMRGRALTVFEKRGGKWVAVADHASVPMPAEAPPAAPAAVPQGR